MEFLTPFRNGTELNQVERWKLARHPLDVYRAVIDRYAPAGPGAPAAIAAVEGEAERLKWVGIYPQRQGVDAHMLRFKVPGGRLGADQAATIGTIADEHARGPVENQFWGSGFCDITTRQDIQMHWIRMADVPGIWERLERVGLTTVQACGDSARNVLGCPVAGVDRDEAFDASPAVAAISAFFTGNRAYANLPRKFKISVTGCVDDCAQAELNDIGLWPARGHQGTLGFNVLVGGGLSDGERLASDLDVFVTLEQAVELTRAIAQVYGELGNREHRGLCRMRYLVQELGPERFRAELARRAAFDLVPAGEAMTRRYRGDHVGVHPQRQPGFSYVGLNVTVGRIAGTDLVEAARLARQYGDGQIRLTTDQNLVLTGVADERLDDLLAEGLLQRHSPFPGRFERGAVACTGTEFCRFAVVETKQRMAAWAQAMDRRFPSPPRDRGKETSDEVIRLHLSGCSASCAQPQIADIGFRGTTSVADGRLVEAVDVGVGGSLGNDGAFLDWVTGAMPTRDAPAGIARILDRFEADRRPGERFHQWARRTPHDVLYALVAGSEPARGSTAPPSGGPRAALAAAAEPLPADLDQP
ncbi:MAG: hypothetical protein J2P58_06960 [Acidimicrobiaceae bacterium]|nr:hypothetical protein [Acidimicrobiaceae bacterium]